MPRLVYIANALRRFKHYNPKVSLEEIALRAERSRGLVQEGWKGTAVKESSASSLLKLIEQNTPSEWRHWPADIQPHWTEYRHNEALAVEDKSTDFLRFILNRQHFLEQLPAAKRCDIYAAAYQWMLAWIYHDLAIRYQISKNDNVSNALRCYQRVIHILVTLSGEQYLYLAHKAALAQWATLYASKPEPNRHKDASVIRWIKERHILEAAYACAEEEPFAWSAIRNGLVVASISKLKSDCDEFHKLLIAADPNFAFLDYKPLAGVKSLKDNPDLEFFHANLDPSLVKYRS